MPIRNIVGWHLNVSDVCKELEIDTLKNRATSFVKMSTLCHSLCKHARSISWQQQNNRREVTCWHFDNNSSSTCVAQLSFFFFYCFYHFIPNPLNYLCDALRTFERRPMSHHRTLVRSLLFFHFSLLLLPLLFGMHFRFNGFQRDALVHLSKIYIKSTYIINFSTVFFPLLSFNRLNLECRTTKEHSGQKCNCIL